MGRGRYSKRLQPFMRGCALSNPSLDAGLEARQGADSLKSQRQIATKGEEILDSYPTFSAF
jgi:hypothetical protein